MNSQEIQVARNFCGLCLCYQLEKIELHKPEKQNFVNENKSLNTALLDGKSRSLPYEDIHHFFQCQQYISDKAQCSQPNKSEQPSHRSSIFQEVDKLSAHEHVHSSSNRIHSHIYTLHICRTYRLRNRIPVFCTSANLSATENQIKLKMELEFHFVSLSP